MDKPALRQPRLRLHDGYTNLFSDVQALQEVLGVKVDGLFGPHTEQAVLDFQKKHGLEEDGIVGPRTWAILLNEEPIPNDRYPTTYANDDRDLSRQLIVIRAYYLTFIQHAATECNVAASAICAIGSRESGWGCSAGLSMPGPAGTGDHGHGRGLMQIDDRSHEFARTGKWNDAEANIHYGAKVLRDALHSLTLSTKLKDAALLRAGFAAYNCGIRNVIRAIEKGLDVDYYTTGRNYGTDALSLTGWFQMQGIK